MGKLLRKNTFSAVSNNLNQKMSHLGTNITQIEAALRKAVTEYDTSSSDERIDSAIDSFVQSLPVEFRARLYNKLIPTLRKPAKAPPEVEAPPPDIDFDPTAVLDSRPDFGDDIKQILELDMAKVKVKRRKRRY
eukprot:gnl/Chilomastix_cuspidata/5413.p1 GENE.gnl/Chilomastix_cuspidata/5413~~gnl/Chilomastix_cuspidata/5413.p1  ORF type:complete len:134 (+),score=23.06 gnl/Chilomastix_cuspidata/5413:317-718(+)